MSQLSTTSVTSFRGLSPRQKKFISLRGPDPGNRVVVEEFTRQFRREFGIKVHWKIMRRLITQVRRKEKRNGLGDTTPKISQSSQFSTKLAPVFRTGNHNHIASFR